MINVITCNCVLKPPLYSQEGAAKIKSKQFSEFGSLTILISSVFDRPLFGSDVVIFFLSKLRIQADQPFRFKLRILLKIPCVFLVIRVTAALSVTVKTFWL